MFEEKQKLCFGNCISYDVSECSLKKYPPKVQQKQAKLMVNQNLITMLQIEAIRKYKCGVDETTVDKTGVDEMVVDETGVDELGCYPTNACSDGLK